MRRQRIFRTTNYVNKRNQNAIVSRVIYWNFTGIFEAYNACCTKNGIFEGTDQEIQD